MSLGNDSLFTAELNYPTLQRGGIHGWMSFYPFVELKGPFEPEFSPLKASQSGPQSSTPIAFSLT
jgi:hypothetical protein